MLIKMKIFFLKSNNKTWFPHLCIHFLDNMYIHVIYFAGSSRSPDENYKYLCWVARVCPWCACFEKFHFIHRGWGRKPCSRWSLYSRWQCISSQELVNNPFKKLGNLTPRKSVSTKDCQVHDKLLNVLLVI